MYSFQILILRDPRMGGNENNADTLGHFDKSRFLQFCFLGETLIEIAKLIMTAPPWYREETPNSVEEWKNKKYL